MEKWPDRLQSIGSKESDTTEATEHACRRNFIMKRNVVKLFVGKIRLTLEQHGLNCQVATCIQIFSVVNTVQQDLWLNLWLWNHGYRRLTMGLKCPGILESLVGLGTKPLRMPRATVKLQAELRMNWRKADHF